MVRRLLSSLNQEISGIHQAALLLGLASIGAKVFALLRDRLLASTFGAGETLDIYFAAFRLPDFLYVSTLLLTTSAAVIPVFMKKEKQGRKAASIFISQLSSIFLGTILVVLTLAFFLMPVISPFIAPGFSEDSLEHLITLSRILLLSPLLLGFSTLLSNVIQSYRRFFIYALSPILYNVGIIMGVLVFYPRMGISGLAWGVILGAILHLLIQIPSLINLNFPPVFSLKIAWRDMRDVFRLSLPRSIGLGLNQIVLIVITAIASAIGAGSIAVFQLSYNLYSIPLGIIGLSYSVAAFPTLARAFADGKNKEFLSGVSTSLRHIIFWATPSVILFIILRAHIVRIILGAGAFSWTDTRLTAAALAFFSIAILAQSIVLLLMRAFYAAGRTRFPVLVTLFSGLLTVGLAFGLVEIIKSNEPIQMFIGSLMRVGDLPQISVLMLVLAYTIGSVINAILLWFGFVKSFRALGLSAQAGGVLARSVTQNFFAAAFLGIITYGVLRLTNTFFDLQTFFGIFVHGFLAGIAGIIAALFILRLLKNQELADIIKALRKKFWKSQIIVPEPRSASEG